jgi:hypothetical protein
MRWRILALAGACLAIPGSVQAQGGIETLSKVELLALQQEMRDRGCGNRHAPGVVTAETRRALRNCMRQHNATTARDLLVSFNIGFGPDEPGGLGVGALDVAVPSRVVRGIARRTQIPTRS